MVNVWLAVVVPGAAIEFNICKWRHARSMARAYGQPVLICVNLFGTYYVFKARV